MKKLSTVNFEKSTYGKKKNQFFDVTGDPHFCLETRLLEEVFFTLEILKNIMSCTVSHPFFCPITQAKDYVFGLIQ